MWWRLASEGWQITVSSSTCIRSSETRSGQPETKRETNCTCCSLSLASARCARPLHHPWCRLYLTTYDPARKRHRNLPELDRIRFYELGFSSSTSVRCTEIPFQSAYCEPRLQVVGPFPESFAGLGRLPTRPRVLGRPAASRGSYHVSSAVVFHQWFRLPGGSPPTHRQSQRAGYSSRRITAQKPQLSEW